MPDVTANGYKMNQFDIGTLKGDGFIFRCSGGLLFLVEEYNGDPWLYRWHEGTRWLRCRPVSPAQIRAFPRDNVTQAVQDSCRELHIEWNRKDDESMKRYWSKQREWKKTLLEEYPCEANNE